MPNAVSTCGRGEVEEINGSGVLPWSKLDFQIRHEPGRRHPEIVPHHHDRLKMLAIALPQGGDQFRVLLTSLGMEPLLELIQDQQHFLPGTQHSSLAAASPGIDQPQSR